MIFPYFSKGIFPADFPMIFPTMNLHSEDFRQEHPKFLADCALLSGSAVASQWPGTEIWRNRERIMENDEDICDIFVKYVCNMFAPFFGFDMFAPFFV